MANLTLTVDDDVLRRARVRALEQGTSVNAVVRDYLAAFAGGEPSRAAVERFLTRARATTASSGPDGRRWTRDDIYADRVN